MFHMPISSPMMTTMLGFCCCCAVAGLPTTIMAASSASMPNHKFRVKRISRVSFHAVEPLKRAGFCFSYLVSWETPVTGGPHFCEYRNALGLPILYNGAMTRLDLCQCERYVAL